MPVQVAGNATLGGITPQRGEGALGTVMAMRVTPYETLCSIAINRLRVFRRAKVAYLCSGVGPKGETSAVPSEKCVARWGSEYDEMRMITTSFARVLERCTGHLYMHFS
jgi:hypothetical protein